MSGMAFHKGGVGSYSVIFSNCKPTGLRADASLGCALYDQGKGQALVMEALLSVEIRVRENNFAS